MAKKKSTDIAQTEAIKTRAGMAEKLEKEIVPPANLIYAVTGTVHPVLLCAA